MSRQIIVKALSGEHLGKVVTISTGHTTATGTLQGFEHEGSVITNLTYSGEEHHPGRVTTHLTLFPGQRVRCELSDEILIHGHTWPATLGNAAHQAEMNGEEVRPHYATVEEFVDADDD